MGVTTTAAAAASIALGVVVLGGAPQAVPINTTNTTTKAQINFCTVLFLDIGRLTIHDYSSEKTILGATLGDEYE
jgi:cobalamin biosynthesis protein CbiD